MSMRRRSRNESESDGDLTKKGIKPNNHPKIQPVVPTLVVACLVVSIVAIGVLQNYYNSSRERDPFGAIVQRQQHAFQLPESQKHSMLSAEEDARLERDADGIRYHLVFSTDCSPYQHWQSYLVYYSAMKVHQPGHVTRIASGCDPMEAAAMTDWFNREVQYMSTRFHLQLTPHFSDVKNDKGESIGDYKFFNKPFGTKYWLEHSPQLQFDLVRQQYSDSIKDDIVILIDPDMGLMRPITRDFSDTRETVIGATRQNHIVTTKVGPGKPAAQLYGFGAQWLRLDVAQIAGEDSPAVKVTTEEARLYYPIGPPYIATVYDMHRLSVKWTEFVPRVYEQFPHLLAEMYGACIAAAHLELPHQIVNSLMISDVGVAEEGWPLIDAIPSNEVCEFARDPDHSKHAVPSVVHLCQRYSVGKEWFFSKRRMPSDIYNCETPLFADPPANLATLYDFKWPPNGKKTPQSKIESHRNAYMLCYLYGLVNEAALFYKQNSCLPETINRQKTRSLVDFFSEAENTQKED
ncbi:hypothetical protein MPSEU_000815800 [Mayamaea pseudoterrestris]|nr:hypothetical protein MPSEU_000815800 [Mayamaea pseudoterrestris]